MVGKAYKKTLVARGVGLAFLAKPEENTFLLFLLLIQEFMDVDVGV